MKLDDGKVLRILDERTNLNEDEQQKALPIVKQIVSDATQSMENNHIVIMENAVYYDMITLIAKNIADDNLRLDIS